MVKMCYFTVEVQEVILINKKGLFRIDINNPYPLAKKPETPIGVLVGLTMITAGALGNIIDCFFYGLIWPETITPGAPFAFMFGQVVDMFYFPLFDYKLPWMEYPRTFFGAVFNFADSCVSVGAVYLLLFQYKFFSKEEF